MSFPLRNGTLSHASEKTIFATLSENRGITTFKQALDSSPDILGFLRKVNRTDCGEDFSFQKKARPADLRAVVPRSKSGHSYGIYSRFRSHPESSPTFGVLNTSPSPIPGMRFQSRVETNCEMSPGPQTYIVTVPSNPTLGLIAREPKFKEHTENYRSFVGPGSYDAKPVYGHTGHEFGKGFNKDESGGQRRSEDSPGPGHYSNRSLDALPAFSIPRSTPPLFHESERVGPGYYRLPDSHRVRASANRFASSPRFYESPQQKIESYRPRYRHLTSEEKEAQRQRFELNKDLSEQNPSSRLRRIAQRSRRGAFQHEVAKIAKANLQATLTERRRTSLQQKFRKFELRVHSQEVEEVAKTWLGISVFAGSLCVFWHKCENRRALHERSQSVLKLLMLLCLSVGVILRKRFLIRKRRAMIVLRKICPMVARLNRKRRAKYREAIALSVERMMVQDIIYQLMRRWVRSLLFVQRAVRHFLVGRRVMYATLKQVWTQVEVDLHKSRGDVPEAVKEYYLSLGVQKKCVSFFAALERYRGECKRLRAARDEEALEQAACAILSGSKAQEVILQLPDAPLYNVFLTKSDLKALILEAEANRGNWERLTLRSRPRLPARAPAKTPL